ncbi:sporulation membrane protein YtaF [Clostridium massiliamazoniense]|uniref:sporulation membrane protein YtaF n=1 Tax=Clostridium massiliamazoniense TaxID=1347366 RepID=UPI0006D83745|nr:sporulation membrane protein YtaF [Clostridium massiliamazoniense]
MLSLFPIILFVLSASIDNFTISVAYGCKNIKIGFFSNLVIAIISALGTFIAMFFGKALLNILTINIANIIGSLALLLIGIYFFIDYLKTKKKPSCHEISKKENKTASDILKYPELADVDKSGSIDIKESVILAIALSLNNLALGIAASASGLNLELTVLFTFIFSLVLIPLGSILSKKILGRFIGEKGSLISSLIIIFISILNLL